MGNDIRLATLVALLTSLGANAAQRPVQVENKPANVPEQRVPPVDFAIAE